MTFFKTFILLNAGLFLTFGVQASPHPCETRHRTLIDCELNVRALIRLREGGQMGEQITQSLQNCLHAKLDEKWLDEFAVTSASRNDGEFVYFHDQGKEVFSTRSFNEGKEQFLYFRGSQRNDFLSFKYFNEEKARFVYLRDSKRDDLFSIKIFSEGENELFYYFRDSKRDDVYSIKVLKEADGEVVYFRDTNRNEIASIKHGVTYRDGARTAVSRKGFIHIVLDQFWKPLRSMSVDEAIKKSESHLKI